MQADNVLALRVALATGLRIGDVLSLSRWDLSSGGIFYVAEKTKKVGFRPLPADLYSVLKRRSARGVGWCFPSATKAGKHRTRQAVWADLRKAARLCNVKAHISPHSTRKTFAANLYRDKGLDAVRDALQHDSVATSMLYAYADRMCAAPVGEIDYELLADLVTARVLSILHKKGVI